MELTTFFSRNKLPTDNKKFLIATSSGPDSMALLDMMRRLVKDSSHQIYVAHIDHCLRKDSFLESQLISEYCDKYNLVFFDKKWEVGLHPKSGIEASARKFRYDFFKELINRYKIDYLITAHHGDDLIENILLKFIRSGNVQEMNSLVEIGDFASAKIVRPLLSWSKEELKQYDIENKVDYIQDKTNFEDEVLRNRLRHHVVPLLKKENTDLIANANNFLNSEKALEDDQSSLFSAVKRPKIILDSITGELSDISTFSNSQKKRYFEWLLAKKWHRKVHFPTQDFTKALTLQKDGFELIIYQDSFYITKQLQDKAMMMPISLDKPFNFLNKQYVVSLKDSWPEMTKIDYFYNIPDLKFYAGSLENGSKLTLADETMVKAKKKFAQAKIPRQLRNRCLSIKTDKSILYVEHTYRWQQYNEKYVCFNIFSNCEDSFK
ncbi:tRNA lysidine(34) synthetase TilS [uncultured Lactobacillus sp.]|uniref:tRNA lysidine(34) synthetase TilS n=1 Tax=uncultured Lactobacillus sp. TaxID=153152 RepID=UPI00262EA1CF|nr:tRNA lysidine(34) synthetase TilS [uncultured Lactobacillus sp.]